MSIDANGKIFFCKKKKKETSHLIITRLCALDSYWPQMNLFIDKVIIWNYFYASIYRLK